MLRLRRLEGENVGKPAARFKLPASPTLLSSVFSEGTPPGRRYANSVENGRMFEKAHKIDKNG
jgi:hypothetical protein